MKLRIDSWPVVFRYSLKKFHTLSVLINRLQTGLLDLEGTVIFASNIFVAAGHQGNFQKLEEVPRQHAFFSEGFKAKVFTYFMCNLCN